MAQENREILTVSLTSSQDSTLCAELSLPATWADFQDALDRVGADHPQDIPLPKVEYTCPDYLWKHLSQDNASLEQLNTLALRVAGLSESKLPVLEGLLQMAQNDGSISCSDPVSTIINLADNVDGHIIVEAHDERELGKLLLEEKRFEHLPEGADKLVSTEYLDYENMVQWAMESGRLVGEWVTGGFFIPGAEIHQSYCGAIDLPKRPPYVFLLQLQNTTGHFRQVTLPMAPNQLDAAVQELGGNRWQLRCNLVDTAVVLPLPLRGDDLDDWNRAAAGIAEMDTKTLRKLKAMVCGMKARNAADLLELMDCMEDFEHQGQLGKETYARGFIERYLPHPKAFEKAILFLDEVGETAAKLENVALTPYGALKRVDGGAIGNMYTYLPPDMRLV